MTTYNHTNIASAGIQANAAHVTTPDGELDAAIGDRSTLTTTDATAMANDIPIVTAIRRLLTKLNVVSDTDGTLKSGAVDVAAVLVDGVVATAKIADRAATFVKIAMNDLLIQWADGAAYELTAATYDSDGVVTTATVKWPDASAGTFTTVTKNTTFLAIDAYTITHTASSKTVTQTAYTRDAQGNITVKPALTIAP
jgi:hypothetical protein